MNATKTEARPSSLPIKPAGIPAPMRSERRWVLWAYCFRDGKWAKIPFATNHNVAKSNDPSTWATIHEAATAFKKRLYNGSGFMLGDGYCGIDLDDVRDATTGQLKPWAIEVIKAVDSFSEVSPSGTGVKIIAKGSKPDGPCKATRDDGSSIEMYGKTRYFTITGHRLPDSPSEVHQRSEQVAAIHSTLIVATRKPRQVGQPVVAGGRRPTRSRGGLSPVERARRYLQKKPGAISFQSGHNTTMVAANAVVNGFALDVGEATPLIQEWNRKCEPPWTDAELLHKLNDTLKNGDPEGRPRGWKIDERHQSNGQATTFAPLTTEADPLAAMNFGEVASANLVIDPIRNFETIWVENKKGEKVPKPSALPIGVIVNDIMQRTGNWPRRVGSMLFVLNLDADGVTWLKNSDLLFGYLGERTHKPPEFINPSAEFHSHPKGEVFAYLPRIVTEYAAVEVLPHEPPLAGHYYACEVPTNGDGGKLSQLVDRFSPETDIDRDLILAAFVTPFWGGRGGTRPAFCLTSDAGRGCGKSTLAACIGDLAGGSVELSNGEDITLVKSRLLSPEGVTKRIALLDNVKSLKFSWAELEALITSPVISGKRLYVGEASRPNNLAFIITLNGVSLATDLAQRCVIIKLRKPDFAGTWAEETRQFIASHRRELVADALAFLREPALPMERFSRWADWERDVLARLPEPAEAQTIIRERQAVADVEREEADLIEEFFSARLAELGYATNTDRIFIPTGVAAKWLESATNDRTTVTKASRSIRQKIDEGQFKRLMECPNRHHGRGFEWWGVNATGNSDLRTDIEHQIEIYQKQSRNFRGNSFE